MADVFLVAWRRIDNAPEGDDARLWLYGIARNVVKNVDRSIRRRSRLRGRLGGLAANADPTPEAVVIRRAEDEEVLRKLEDLRPIDREVLRLSVWEQLGNNEIATVLDIEPHAVTMRLRRARSRMARSLGIEVPPPSSFRPQPANKRGEL